MELASETMVLIFSKTRSSQKMIFCQAFTIRSSCPQMFYKIATPKILKIPGNLQTFRDTFISEHF